MEIIAVKTFEDFQNVEKLAKEIWEEHYIPIIGEAQVDYMLKKFQAAAVMQGQLNKGYEYFLVQEENINIGYFAFRVSHPELFLSKIYLLKEMRGLGIGKAMMKFIEDEAYDRGLNQLRLTVNKYNQNSIRAYGQLGFIQSRELVQDIGESFVMDDFEFIKKL